MSPWVVTSTSPTSAFTRSLDEAAMPTGIATAIHPISTATLIVDDSSVTWTTLTISGSASSTTIADVARESSQGSMHPVSPQVSNMTVIAVVVGIGLSIAFAMTATSIWYIIHQDKITSRKYARRKRISERLNRRTFTFGIGAKAELGAGHEPDHRHELPANEVIRVETYTKKL